jgi:hypothetical protein
LLRASKLEVLKLVAQILLNFKEIMLPYLGRIKTALTYFLREVCLRDSDLDSYIELLQLVK